MSMKCVRFSFIRLLNTWKYQLLRPITHSHTPKLNLASVIMAIWSDWILGTCSAQKIHVAIKSLFTCLCYSSHFVVSFAFFLEKVARSCLLLARLIKEELCSGWSPFGAGRETKAASVAALFKSSRVGQTEQHTEIYI